MVTSFCVVTGVLSSLSLGVWDAVPYFTCFMAVGELLRKKDGIPVLLKKWYWNLAILAVFVCLSLFNGSVNLSCGNYGISMFLYLFIGSLGSVLVFLVGALLERFCGIVIKVSSLIGQETLTILCFHMFLFMFIKVGVGIVGLGAGLTKASLVVGSLILLTPVGKLKK